MARILVVTPPLVGHLNPALALAHSLKARGHTVAWAVHQAKVGHLLPEGDAIFDLGVQDTVTSIEAPQVRGLESVRLFFEDYALPMAREAIPVLSAIVAEAQPDLMLVDHQMVAGALVATLSGTPWFSVVTTSASILKLSDTLDDWVAQQYQALQHQFLPSHLHRLRPDFSPSQVIVFSSEALIPRGQARVEAPYFFVGPCQPAGRKAVDFPWAALKADYRKVFLSLGTVSRDRDLRFYHVFMEAASRIPQLQLIVAGPEELRLEAPDCVLVQGHVPQMELLAHVDAVVCHAGHNTVFETLQQGLPLGLAPIRDDQPVVARMVIDAGAGVFIRHGKVTVNMAEQVLITLLEDASLKQAALQLSQVLRQSPGTLGAVDCIETHLTSQQKPEEIAT